MAPENGIEPINPYFRVFEEMASKKTATLIQPMKIALPRTEGIRPPAFRHRNHIARQNPPSKHPIPSARSLKIKATPPASDPEKTTAIRNAPWTPSLTGGFIQYMIRTVVARETR